MTSIPVIPTAFKKRLIVAAIDFGTTYSGYAFSFRSDYEEDPLKIVANQWKEGNGRTVSLKTPTCVLFDPNQKFHSFGFAAEDKYSELSLDEENENWHFFSRFKMLLYDNKKLKRTTELQDDQGQKMPAMTVFTECIRYLKDHMLESLKNKKVDTLIDHASIHWVLTVPAIWNDTAKQFMREAAVNAEIATDNLSLALEPEAASLFCKYLPVAKVESAKGGSIISCFSPGTKYLVFDAGGGTIDITVHETQEDLTIRELYKANGGPWGGTKIDQAFLDFLREIAGKDTVDVFEKDFKNDYIDLFREMEIKKASFTPDMNHKITFRIPPCIHENYKKLNGQDFRHSLMMRQDLKDDISFSGDKLRVEPVQIAKLFTETCDTIVSHLKDIFTEPTVQDTDKILMVGGFSESKILQNAIIRNFPNKRVIIPEEAGLSVLKGAVLYGHNPTAIISRVSKFTYGIKTTRRFDPSQHPESKRFVVNGKDRCHDCFSKHVEVGQEVHVGEEFKEKHYYPLKHSQTIVGIKTYMSSIKDPKYVDDSECTLIGRIGMDVSGIERFEDRGIGVTMIYGGTELGVKASFLNTGDVLSASYDFL